MVDLSGLVERKTFKEFWIDLHNATGLLSRDLLREFLQVKNQPEDLIKKYFIDRYKIQLEHHYFKEKA